MSKKIVVLALSVVGIAMFGIPGVASATPAHIDVAENFTASSIGPMTREKSNGEITTCHKGMSGAGGFTTTTTGTLTLSFHECTTKILGFDVWCQSPGEPTGTIKTTTLTFHLITFAANKPGVLITPNATAEGNHFATFECGGVKKFLRGNGVIGTITNPAPGTAAKVHTLKFEQGITTGNQKHQAYTGVNYNLEEGGLKVAEIGEGTITFANARKITTT